MVRREGQHSLSVRIQMSIDTSKVEAYLDNEPNRLDDFVKKLQTSGEQLQQEIRSRSPVRTGALKDSILDVKDDGFEIQMNAYGMYIDQKRCKVQGWLSSILDPYKDTLFQEVVSYVKEIWLP